jgi:hypothetical protein
MKKLFFTLIFTTAMISMLTAQKENAAVKEAIAYAGNVAFVHTDKNTGVLKNMLNPKLIEHPSFVFYMGNGEDARIKLNTAFGKDYYESLGFRMRNTNLYDGKAYVAFAGTYVLLVPRKGSVIEMTPGGIKKVELDTLTFNFEEGKYYTIESRVDNETNLIVDFSIKETDIEPYLAYQAANPDRLDGTWSGEGKYLWTTFLNQYSFDGNSMKFEGESKNPKQTFVVEGKMMYNENTIIFFPERASHKGKEIKNFNSRADRMVYIWYYTLTDNELHIEAGNPFLIATQSWVNTGNFFKNN